MPHKLFVCGGFELTARVYRRPSQRSLRLHLHINMNMRPSLSITGLGHAEVFAPPRTPHRHCGQQYNTAMTVGDLRNCDGFIIQET